MLPGRSSLFCFPEAKRNPSSRRTSIFGSTYGGKREATIENTYQLDAKEPPTLLDLRKIMADVLEGINSSSCSRNLSSINFQMYLLKIQILARTLFDKHPTNRILPRLTSIILNCDIISYNLYCRVLLKFNIRFLHTDKFDDRSKSKNPCTNSSNDDTTIPLCNTGISNGTQRAASNDRNQLFVGSRTRQFYKRILLKYQHDDYCELPYGLL